MNASESSPAATFLAILRRWLDAGTGGGIEWVDGKRRRIVFLDGATLTEVQSNLRSESPERLAELGTPDPASAARAARLGGLLREVAGVVSAHPGAVAPSPAPVPLARALAEVAAHLPTVPNDATPAAVPAHLARLDAAGLAPGLAAYLADLDGTRTADDVVDFGPAEPDAVAQALALAAALGAVTVGAAEAVPRVVAGGSSGIRSSGLFEGHAAPGASDEYSTGDAPTPRVQASHAVERLDARPAAPPPPREPELTDAELRNRILGAANHFQTLGVEWQESPDSLRRIYVALAARLHPDRYAMAPTAQRLEMEELFNRVREAWETLGDAARRDTYTRRVIFGELSEEEKAQKQMQAIFEAERLLTMAQRELAAQRFSQALALLRQAQESAPDHPQIAAYGAYAYVRSNPGRTGPEIDEAVAAIDAVSKSIPTADWARLLVARTRAARGDLAGAERATIETLKLNPSNPDAVADLRKLRNAKPEAPAASTGSFLDRLFKR